MTEWIRRSERVTKVTFSRSFEWADTPGAGFGFDCNEDGSLLTNERGEPVNQWGGVWHPDALANYQMCLRGEDEEGRKILDTGVTRYEHSYTEPGVIRCSVCTGEVTLHMVMTNTCDNCRTCGQPERTGEHLLTADECQGFMQSHEDVSGCPDLTAHHEFTECAADYNSSGQRLAPREQWGWDTGESLDEILSSDWPVGVSPAEWNGEDL